MHQGNRGHALMKSAADKEYLDLRQALGYRDVEKIINQASLIWTIAFL